MTDLTSDSKSLNQLVWRRENTARGREHYVVKEREKTLCYNMSVFVLAEALNAHVRAFSLYPDFQEILRPYSDITIACIWVKQTRMYEIVCPCQIDYSAIAISGTYYCYYSTYNYYHAYHSASTLCMYRCIKLFQVNIFLIRILILASMIQRCSLI